MARSDLAAAPVVAESLIAGRYRLLYPLGAGASATVWAAMDETLGRHVALKLLSDAAAADAAERERLRREARALATLAHPRIIIVFDYLETAIAHGAMQPILVTELLEGHSLAARLEHGPLPWPEALAVCGQLADALVATHRAGIVHRDISPRNVMLTAEGTKLLDFGIAQGPADRGPTDGTATGTPVCMAPEQLTGRGAVPASDLYALGCVLYWCLTGRPPFPETDMAQLSSAHLLFTPPALQVPGLPEGIAELYRDCLAKDPSARPTAEQALRQFAPYAQHTDADPSPPGSTELTQTMSAVGDAATRAPGKPRSVARHGANRFRIDRRRMLPAALVVVALALITALLLVAAHEVTGGHASATTTQTTSPISPTTATATATAVATDSAALAPPSPSATMAMAGAIPPTASPGPSFAMATVRSLPDPATDPLGYLQGMSGQIQDLTAQGPSYLQPAAAQNLQSALAALQTALAAAEQHGGKKQWTAVHSQVAGIEQQLAADASAGTISQDASSLLTGELQQLDAHLPTTGR